MNGLDFLNALLMLILFPLRFVNYEGYGGEYTERRDKKVLVLRLKEKQKTEMRLKYFTLL